MERSPCPISASNTRPLNSSCVMWISSWQPVTIGRERWRKKPPRASRFMGVRKMRPGYAAFWTNAKSLQKSSRYEHPTGPYRRPKSPRLHGSRGSLSLHCGDAFRLLRSPSIPRFHRCQLGQANDYVLEQTSHQEACPDRMLSKERNGLSLVFTPALSPDRAHPKAPRDARFCSHAPRMELPRD